MKPARQLGRVKISERIYRWLVRLYPAPFRKAFGHSMEQVFCDQCLDAVQRKGTLGLMALWLRVLSDFVWTCPKEHLMALPALPRRVWEALALQSLWRLPALLAGMCLLLAVTVSLLLPQYYSSTATIEVKRQAAPGGTEAGFDPYFLQTEFEKLASKSVLYPVIETLNLRAHYGIRSGSAMESPHQLSIEEAYRYLCGNLNIGQFRSTELINVTVFDVDPELARRIANEIVAGYQHWQADAAVSSLLRSRDVSLDQTPPPLEVSIRSEGKTETEQLAGAIATAHRSVKIINPAEVALRPTRPNRYLNIMLGGVAAMAIGGITLLVLWLIRRFRHREAVPV